MRCPKQVSEGLRLLPENADREGAVADGGAQEELQEARQDQLNLVDVLGLPLILLLGQEQVDKRRIRQALKRNRAVEKSVFHNFMGGSF